MTNNLQMLKDARNRKGWTQAEAAVRLGVSQGYLSLLERGLRGASPGLVETARRLFGPDVSLSLQDHSLVPADDLAKRLAGLGYEPLAYLAGRAKQPPQEVLLAALSHPDLEARLVEALPWVAFAFPQLDWDWLVDSVKRRDLQNRLGYVTTLAREVAEQKGDSQTVFSLREVEDRLQRSILAREDTLCRDSMTAAERNWLLEKRPDQAKRWRVLSDLRSEHLPYAA